MGASASPIVKAVLDNVGRRYLVEHTEADDGSWWADRYSDGWVELNMTVYSPNPTRDYTQFVTFPIEFRDTKYSCLVQCFKDDDDANSRTATSDLFGRKTNGAYCGWFCQWESPITGMIIQVQGYAA